MARDHRELAVGEQALPVSHYGTATLRLAALSGSLCGRGKHTRLGVRLPSTYNFTHVSAMHAPSPPSPPLHL